MAVVGGGGGSDIKGVPLYLSVNRNSREPITGLCQRVKLLVVFCILMLFNLLYKGGLALLGALKALAYSAQNSKSIIIFN